MIMSPAVRRIALTAHVVASVGWLGSVAAFLVLALAGLRSADEQTVRSAYVAADLVTRGAILPLCFASFATGLLQSMGTWGLFRHYRVVMKLVLTVGSTALLLLHTRPIGWVAQEAAAGPLASTALRPVRVQILADTVAALSVLLVTAVLSVFKPKGVTRYGWRKQREERGALTR